MKLGILTYFQFNQAFIVEQFSENKERHLLNCNGQCFLAKKLQAAEEGKNESERSRTSHQQIEIPTFLVATPSLISFRMEEIAVELPLFENHYFFIKLTKLFHPPEFIS